MKYKTCIALQTNRLEVQIQEQSITELAGLTTLEHDLKRNAQVTLKLKEGCCTNTAA